MASIQINRGNKAEIDNTPITDGLISFQTDDGRIFLDTDNTRDSYGGDKVVPNSEDTPTDILETLGFNGTTYGIYSGHNIKNQSGTTLPRRDAVKVVGAYTHDDEDENETRIDITREMTTNEKDSLSGEDANGFQWVTDDTDFPLTTDFIGYNDNGTDKSLTEKIAELDSEVTDMALEDLSDTNIDTETLEDGQILEWDSTSEKWVNNDNIKVDNEIIFDSHNPVQSKVIYDFINDLLPEGNESGNPIAISDASGLDAKEVKINLEPIQDLSHGDPSPTNICPISGRNSVNITVNEDTETINFDETIYGGEIDVKNGGTSNKYIKINASTIIANYGSFNAPKHLYYVTFTSLLNAIPLNTATVKNPCNMACNILPFDFNWNEIQNFDGSTPCCGMYHNTDWDYTKLYLILPSTVTTRQEAETWLNNSGIEITYELATPTTLSTPSNTITLEKGNNTLSTTDENGTINLKYSKQLVNNNNALTSLLSLNNNEEDNNNEET